MFSLLADDLVHIHPYALYAACLYLQAAEMHTLVAQFPIIGFLI
jgi:hypothetical protein